MVRYKGFLDLCRPYGLSLTKVSNLHLEPQRFKKIKQVRFVCHSKKRR